MRRLSWKKARRAGLAVWAAPLVVAAGCATGSISSEPSTEAGGERAVPGEAAGGRLYPLVPGHAHSVLFLDYAAIRAAGGAALLAHPAAAEASRAARGFSEDREVDEALQVALGSDNLNLFEGHFESAAIEASRIGRAGRTHYRDRTLWEDGLDVLGRLSEAQLAFGDPAAVRAVIDCAASLCDPLTETAWFVAATRALRADWREAARVFVELRALLTEDVRARIPPEYAELGELSWLAVRAGGEDDLVVQAVGQAADAQRARGIAAWARQTLSALAETPTVVQLGFSPLVQRTRVELGRRGGVENVVSWRLQLSPDERTMVMQRIDALFQAARRADAPDAPATDAAR